MNEYVLSVVAASAICAAVRILVDHKSAIGKIVCLLSSILMAVTIIAPLENITFDGVSNFWSELSTDANKYTQEGISTAEKQRFEIIKSQSEAYILDKADRLGLEIAVEVELDDQNGNIPCGVVISGSISPYAQMQLETYIEDTLAIPKESQKWR